MDIVITGASGVVGQILTMHLSPWHKVIPLNGRQDVDLMSLSSVNDFFHARRFDVVIHCAVAGARDVSDPSPSITHKNLTMYENLKQNYNGFDKLINIASGVELGYGGNKQEIELRNQLPELPYALSKNLIARDIMKHVEWHNLRLYGLISNTRIFWKLWDLVNRGEKEIQIVDKYMDYISEDDMVKVVKYFAETSFIPEKDVNMVYRDKKKVSQVVQDYIKEHNLDIEVKILETAPSSEDYTGDGYRLARINIL
jgi:nucleoside-diphosphate-sugar epimerase